MGLSAGFIQFPGGSEWIIIFLVILIIFGPRSLPKIGHAIGKGIREFRDASEGIQRAIEEEASAERKSIEKQTSVETAVGGENHEAGETDVGATEPGADETDREREHMD